MLRSKIIPATMAAVIALGVTGGAFAASGGSDNTQEIAAALGAKTSITQAIAAAEQQTGGRALKIGLEMEKGSYLYEITTASKDKIAEVSVDPTSGKVVRTDDKGLIARFFDSEDRGKLSELTASPTTLAAAIAAAEQHTGGKAIEASFDDEDGSVQFEIEVAKDGLVHKVQIDSASGKVLKVAAAEAGEHDED
ncbi:MAG: PepSY domain-containing protein [Gammaproteobacteria bacterium]